MKKLAAVLTSLAFGAAAMVAPALATTQTSSTGANGYGTHALDCLALLFADPKAHAEQCGGPNFVLPDPPHGSTGFAAGCSVGEIDPFGIDGVQYKLVATTCCFGSISPDQWQPLGTDMLVWDEPASRVALTAC